MNEQAQRIAIAESVGWIECELYRPPPEVHIDDPCFTPRSFLRGFKPGVALWQPIPDFLSDLNAMHEVEKTLFANGGPACAEYCSGLSRICFEGTNHATWFLIHATAKQRAEAYLRCIGKWQETAKAAA